MNNTLLIDTNMLLYAIDADSKFHDDALRLISSTDYELFITPKNISEFLVALTRNSEIEIDSCEALEILDDILWNLKILYPNSTTFQKFNELIFKYHPKGLWIHDIEIASIAISYGVYKVATRNIDDFKRIKEIEVVTL